MLVPRLTPQAARELQAVEAILHQSLSFSDEPDIRECFAASVDNKPHAGAVYQLLRGEGAAMDDAMRSKFVWKNGAPPRVRFFGWLASRAGGASSAALTLPSRGSSRMICVKYARLKLRRRRTFCSIVTLRNGFGRACRWGLRGVGAMRCSI